MHAKRREGIKKERDVREEMKGGKGVRIYDNEWLGLQQEAKHVPVPRRRRIRWYRKDKREMDSSGEGYCRIWIRKGLMEGGRGIVRHSWDEQATKTGGPGCLWILAISLKNWLEINLEAYFSKCHRKHYVIKTLGVLETFFAARNLSQNHILSLSSLPTFHSISSPARSRLIILSLGK